MNIDDIRDRALRCEEARDAGAGTVGAYGWAAAAIASAADVPLLVQEIEGLRATLNLRDGQLTVARRHADERGEALREAQREIERLTLACNAVEEANRMLAASNDGMLVENDELKDALKRFGWREDGAC